MLPKDRVHVFPADIGKLIKPRPVIDKVIEVDVAPIIKILSTDSIIVFTVLYFYYLFLIFSFCLWNIWSFLYCCWYVYENY